MEDFSGACKTTLLHEVFSFANFIWPQIHKIKYPQSGLHVNYKYFGIAKCIIFFKNVSRHLSKSRHKEAALNNGVWLMQYYISGFQGAP